MARAEGGVGLLQTAAAYAHAAGQGRVGLASVVSAPMNTFPGWNALPAGVSATGARSSVQAHHGCVRAEKTLSGLEVVGPWEDAQTGVRGMTTDGVQQVVPARRERTGPHFHSGLRLSAERYGLVFEDRVQLVGELFASGDTAILDLSLWDVAKLPAHAPEGGRTLLEHFLDLPRHGTVLSRDAGPPPLGKTHGAVRELLREQLAKTGGRLSSSTSPRHASDGVRGGIRRRAPNSLARHLLARDRRGHVPPAPHRWPGHTPR